MADYTTEINKLIKGLEKLNIPHRLYLLYDGWRVEGNGWDAICHSFSCGHENGLLEAMGKPIVKTINNTVEGYLTAEEILCRLEENFSKNS